MSDNDFDLDDNFESDFEQEDVDSRDNESSSVRPSTPKVKNGTKRRHLEDILEEERLRKEVQEFDELRPKKLSDYDDDIFSQM